MSIFLIDGGFIDLFKADSSKWLILLQEWGDPRKEEFYFYMKSYSPVDNVSSNAPIHQFIFEFLENLKGYNENTW